MIIANSIHIHTNIYNTNSIDRVLMFCVFNLKFLFVCILDYYWAL